MIIIIINIIIIIININIILINIINIINNNINIVCLYIENKLHITFFQNLNSIILKIWIFEK